MPTAAEIARARVEEADARRASEEAQAASLHARAETQKWLEQWGLKLEELPAGIQGDPQACVLAEALGGAWNGSDWAVPEARLAHKLGYENIELPPVVRDFISRFDRGEYPDLIKEA
jgi:hypothetical protein